jgi:hypothetical protein
MRARPVVILTVLGVFALGSVAEAHFLEKPRARKASENQARSVCNQVQGCQSSRVRNCPRKSSHRVQCNVRTFNDGGVICDWTDEWFIRGSSARLEYNFGKFNRTLRCR